MLFAGKFYYYYSIDNVIFINIFTDFGIVVFTRISDNDSVYFSGGVTCLDKLSYHIIIFIVIIISCFNFDNLL